MVLIRVFDPIARTDEDDFAWASRFEIPHLGAHARYVAGVSCVRHASSSPRVVMER